VSEPGGAADIAAGDLAALARQIMTGKALIVALEQAGVPARAAMLAAMAATGAEKVRVRDAEGTDFGVVSWTSGAQIAVVDDPAALLDWVKARHPGEVVDAIRPAYLTKLLGDAGKAGTGVDLATGEVVPGIKVVTGEPYVQARPTKTAYARAADLVDGGPLSLIAPPPGGDQSDTPGTGVD
jgi:hypothetical protein